MFRILFTRHAQTKKNVDGTVQGHEDGDINEKGYWQIEKLKQRIKKEKIDIVISSDIPRCRITTEGIIEGRNISVEYTTILREKNNGDLVGKKADEVNWEDLGGDFETRKAPNGENLIEVRERGRKFINEILKKYKNADKTILVVSHGAFLKILIGDLIGTSLHNAIFKLFIDHCSLTRVDFDDKYKEGFNIKYVNENEFLGEARNWIEPKKSR